MTMAGEATGPLDIGRVIQQLFAVLGRNFATFFILSLILTGIPGVIIGLIQMDGFQHAQFFRWQSLLAGLVGAVTGLILQGTVIYGTVTDLSEGRVTLADCLSVGLRSFLALLAIGLLMGVAIFFGMILLIVPGVIMAIVWSVTVPVYVVEQREVFASFGRSVDLTRGNRWRIFGLAVIYFVAFIVVGLVVGALGGVAGVFGSGSAMTLRFVLVQPLINAVVAMIGAVGVAVLYVELRRLRDGVDAAGLAAVFD